MPVYLKGFVPESGVILIVGGGVNAGNVLPYIPDPVHIRKFPGASFQFFHTVPAFVFF